MATEAEQPDLVEHDRPGKQERDFEVEQDEQDGDEVIAHVELHARVLEGLEAAFVGGKFFAVPAVRPEQRAGDDRPDADGEADEDEHQNREVIFEHGSLDSGVDD